MYAELPTLEQKVMEPRLVRQNRYFSLGMLEEAPVIRWMRLLVEPRVKEG